MTNDGINTLTYDAENHAVSVNGSGGAYTYDGNGLRVKKVAGSTTTVYIFSGAKVIAEYDNGAAPTAPSREYVYGGAALLAKIAGSTTTYYHQDHLSNRLVTSSTGATVEQLGHFPYGYSWYNASNDKLLFTTYERDAESGNDYAMARTYINRLGRFSSFDPLAGSPSDPQSLNRYSYVLNDPLTYVDPTGQLCVLPDGTRLQGPSDPGSVNCHAMGGVWSCTPGIICVDSPAKGDSPGGPPPSSPPPPLNNPGYTSPSIGGGDVGYFGQGTRGGGGSTTLDDRTNALAHAVISKGVLALQNPCTPAAFYLTSAIGGTGAAAAMNSEEVGLAAVNNAPNAMNWLYRQVLKGGPVANFVLVTVPKYYNKTKDAVTNGCNAIQ